MHARQMTWGRSWIFGWCNRWKVTRQLTRLRRCRYCTWASTWVYGWKCTWRIIVQAWCVGWRCRRSGGLAFLSTNNLVIRDSDTRIVSHSIVRNLDRRIIGYTCDWLHCWTWCKATGRWIARKVTNLRLYPLVDG